MLGGNYAFRNAKKRETDHREGQQATSLPALPQLLHHRIRVTTSFIGVCQGNSPETTNAGWRFENENISLIETCFLLDTLLAVTAAAGATACCCSTLSDRPARGAWLHRGSLAEAAAGHTGEPLASALATEEKAPSTAAGAAAEAQRRFESEMARRTLGERDAPKDSEVRCDPSNYTIHDSPKRSVSSHI